MDKLLTEPHTLTVRIGTDTAIEKELQSTKLYRLAHHFGEQFFVLLKHFPIAIHNKD
jgi:hypothetical protein